MGLTREFKETVKLRAQKDMKFRRALLIDAINEFLEGDIELAKLILRDYINATISFGTLAKGMKKDAKSIQRMLSPKGNPSSRALAKLFSILQRKEGIHLKVKAA